MSGIILRPNKAMREKTLDRMMRHKDAADGKNDILLTWEECSTEVVVNEQDYLVRLRARIRRERVLLSHIRP